MQIYSPLWDGQLTLCCKRRRSCRHQCSIYPVDTGGTGIAVVVLGSTVGLRTPSIATASWTEPGSDHTHTVSDIDSCSWRGMEHEQRFVAVYVGIHESRRPSRAGEEG